MPSFESVIDIVNELMYAVIDHRAFSGVSSTNAVALAVFVLFIIIIIIIIKQDFIHIYFFVVVSFFFSLNGVEGGHNRSAIT